MSFNLNKLVQPECGGSNPLVAAAQQISAPGATSRLRPQAPMNFAREFMEQHKDDIRVIGQPGSSGALRPSFQSASISSTSSSSNMMGYQPMMHPQMIGGMGQNHNQENISNVTAGDQLEAKFREDTKDTSKLDDIAFWQSLSQKYNGPATYDAMAQQVETKTSELKLDDDNLAESQQMDDAQAMDSDLFNDLAGLPTFSEPSMEYTFDERNPLKDQFEDPFAEGLKKLEQGDIPSAVLLFEAAVQLKPEDAVAWRYLGTTQALNENDKSAIKAMKNCLKLNPDDQQARLAISVSLANESERQEACRYLIEWLTRHEKYKTVGASLEEFSKFKEGAFSTWTHSNEPRAFDYVRDKLVAAARMLPNNPDPEVQNSLGVLFNISGEYERAIDCFKAALSVRSDDSVLWNRLGATLANGNRSDEAVIAYKKALEISPGFLRTRYNLAISLVHLNFYDEAAKQLVQILNMQAAGKGSKDALIRSRSVTSTTIWNTLRTVATLQNRPDLYSIIEGRDLAKCNEIILKLDSGSN